MIKNCLRCNEVYECKPSKFKERIYCSKLCASIERKVKFLINKCDECKIEYEILPCRKEKSKFCSSICAKIGKVKTRKYTPKGERILIEKKCERCNKSFDCNPSSGNVARFCSMECVKQKNGNAICVQCKIKYEYIPRSRHHSFKFCSKKCHGVFNTENSFWKTASQEEIIDHIRKLFESKVKKLENGCWEWLGGKYKAGYGGTFYKGKAMKVHRLSYMYHNNDWNISIDDLICHRCDTVWCCAPSHLFKGTAKDNMKDMISKGRQNYQKGERASNAKMTEETAREVLRLLKLKTPMTKIALILNIGKGSVNSIKRNRSWKHIKIEE